MSTPSCCQVPTPMQLDNVDSNLTRNQGSTQTLINKFEFRLTVGEGKVYKCYNEFLEGEGHFRQFKKNWVQFWLHNSVWPKSARSQTFEKL